MRKTNDSNGAENPVAIFFETARRAFAEFLFFPTCIIVGFLLLALVTYAFDRARIGEPGPLREFLKSHIFANSEATSSLLAAIAAGLITMTSITISLLLIAVQQSASTLTGQVYDQFLRRKANQIYFGFFIGLALYSLITLATVNDPFNPVFGATVAFIGTAVSLYLLILLLYTTINQMRPIEVIETIHEHILAARGRQLSLIRKTKRRREARWKFTMPVRSERHGFITGIDVDRIAVTGAGGEVDFLMPLGRFVAFQDVFAEARADTHDEASRLASAAKSAVRIERQRDIAIDPAYGIEQLEMIGWTSISTAKSNPAPGLFAIQCLRDVLARWSLEEVDESVGTPAPVIYHDDSFDRLLDTFESFAVVSSESMQHQVFTELLRTVTTMFERLPIDYKPRAENLVLRMLSVLGDHALTAELDKALSEVTSMFDRTGKQDTAAAVREAHERLARSVGVLNSRATRTKT
jgi:uncharacterized membrane protein